MDKIDTIEQLSKRIEAVNLNQSGTISSNMQTINSCAEILKDINKQRDKLREMQETIEAKLSGLAAAGPIDGGYISVIVIQSPIQEYQLKVKAVSVERLAQVMDDGQLYYIRPQHMFAAYFPAGIGLVKGGVAQIFGAGTGEQRIKMRICADSSHFHNISSSSRPPPTCKYYHPGMLDRFHIYPPMLGALNDTWLQSVDNIASVETGTNENANNMLILSQLLITTLVYGAIVADKYGESWASVTL
jgi:hypothetical protein